MVLSVFYAGFSKDLKLNPNNKGYKAKLKEWWGLNCDSKSDKTTLIYRNAETQKSKLFSDVLSIFPDAELIDVNTKDDDE